MPAPEKLNIARAKKGLELVRPLIVIDMRAAWLAALERRGEGGWTARPHWRRGYIRWLPAGRAVLVPPRCVNMETGIAIEPE